MVEEMFENNTSKLEMDILFVFYSFSDQYGRVDIPAAKQWAYQRLGITIPDKPFTLTQKHINTLMDAKLVPDTRQMIAKACATQERRKSPRSNKSKNKDDL